MSNRLIQGMLCLSVLLFSPVMTSENHRIAPLGIDALSICKWGINHEC